MIKAIIFDLDGTLSNTINSIAFFANQTLNHYGFPSIPTEKYKILTGNGARTLVERMLDYVKCKDNSILEDFLAEYNKAYDDDFLYLTSPYDGIVAMLKALKSKGIKTAVLSNKPNSTTIQVVDALFKDCEIDVVFGGRENVPLKPNPMAVNEVIKLLGVEKSQCLYVGDTATDMETAHNANLFSVGVLWGFRDEMELKNAKAHKIITHPSELLDLI